MPQLVADGRTLNTRALQAMIDAAGGAGGGTITLPIGPILTGGLTLRSGVHLHLPAGAVLLGSTDLADYPLLDPPPIRFLEDKEGLRALLLAHQCRDIRITGPGTIDGQGPLWRKYNGKVRAGRPRNIWFADCRSVSVENIHLRCSGFWMQHYVRCDGLRLHGLDVFNHGSSNNDGCDIDGCRNVIVSDCRIDSHDDALCLKSGNSTPTEHVVITNCITRTHCNHLKTGTESNGGFRHITVSNLHCTPSSISETDPHTEGGDYRGACGIALGCVDGGNLEDISISHVTMDQTQVPLFVRLGDRGRPISGSNTRQPVGQARGVRISHVTARNASRRGCYIMGVADSPVRDVCLSDCLLEFAGDGSAEAARRTPDERRDCYPSCDAFGDLPAFGLYLRDVHGIQLRNLELRCLQPDHRPALAWQRCRDVRLIEVSQCESA